MSDICVFCRILAGELPATRLYEDEDVLAFLDIAPINKGHLLVIPKRHHRSLTELAPEQVGRLFAAAARLGRALVRAVQADGFNLLLSNGTVAGQVVPHVHVHLIPRFPDDGIRLPARALRYTDDAERDAIAAEIRRRLGAEDAAPA
jgi:histidine triad (HIT) family protein